MPHHQVEPGQILDGFLVGERLHRGGMATIWAASHPDIATPIVMKIPILSEGEDPAAIVSFEMEQMILPRLSGRHVPRWFANGDFSGQPYLVMERIDGRSVFCELDHLPLPIDKVAALGADIAQALHDLHRQRVVHLDVKPSNLMRRPDGSIVLLDFGLSRHDQLPDLMAEEFRLPYGTAPYMAPEQVLGVRNDPRSDLFALGVLLYFFATGTRPFGDPQTLGGLKKRLWRDPVPPRALNDSVPPWFQEVVLCCLDPDPTRRPPTAAQLAFDLRHPDCVGLSPLAHKRAADGFWTVMRRRWTGEPAAKARQGALTAQMAAAPIIALAIDLDYIHDDLTEALRFQAMRLIRAMPAARLACLNVMRLARLAVDRGVDEEGRNKHAARLGALRRWAAPLNLPESRVTYHILEAVDPAAAILDYIARNHVDHIIIGARANSRIRTLLGSTSAQIAAHAACTVTVVRNRTDKIEAADQSDIPKLDVI